MNLKTKLAIVEDVSWKQASIEADNDVEFFNCYYAYDWLHYNCSDDESEFYNDGDEDEDELKVYSKYGFVDDF